MIQPQLLSLLRESVRHHAFQHGQPSLGRHEVTLLLGAQDKCSAHERLVQV